MTAARSGEASTATTGQARRWGKVVCVTAVLGLAFAVLPAHAAPIEEWQVIEETAGSLGLTWSSAFASVGRSASAIGAASGTDGR